MYVAAAFEIMTIAEFLMISAASSTIMNIVLMTASVMSGDSRSALVYGTLSILSFITFCQAYHVNGSVTVTGKKGTARLEIEGAGDAAVSEGGSNTSIVWDKITPTQENYPSTNIARSFEVEVNGQKMWVHGNATEHMYEDVYKGITTGNGTAYTNPNLYTQELMSDFYGSLEKATSVLTC